MAKQATSVVLTLIGMCKREKGVRLNPGQARYRISPMENSNLVERTFQMNGQSVIS